MFDHVKRAHRAFELYTEPFQVSPNFIREGTWIFRGRAHNGDYLTLFANREGGY